MANTNKPTTETQIAIRDLAAEIEGASKKLSDLVKKFGDDVKEGATAVKGKEDAMLSSAHEKNYEKKLGTTPAQEQTSESENDSKHRPG